ncbi:hypothetical protein EYC84_011902 [Monilinia fructicola]|uniref:Uncharacterized protein n=1 Tax=Monilinia fructicola TaxID=38448 RepID=A0A5M9J4Q9_MONFR|nr:hypothetical protein EYC84_011902 [Monilinia fructicola]
MRFRRRLPHSHWLHGGRVVMQGEVIIMCHGVHTNTPSTFAADFCGRRKIRKTSKCKHQPDPLTPCYDRIHRTSYIHRDSNPDSNSSRAMKPSIKQLWANLRKMESVNFDIHLMELSLSQATGLSS